MEKYKVSVIVPVYNRENCIERCIMSICNQSYLNLEILIIDDGSTDLTLERCKTMEENDNRIKVFAKEWGGVSKARNFGIEHATGEYLQFVDGDDFLKEYATEIFLKNMEGSKSDLIVCGYEKRMSGLTLRRNQLDWPKQYSSSQYLIQTLKDPGHHYYGAIWNKFYRREIVQKNGLRFDDSISLGEDFIFNLHYLKYCKNVKVIRNKLYVYNCLEENTLSRYAKNLESCKRELNARHQIFHEYQEVFRYFDLYQQYETRIQRYWLTYLAVNIYYIRHEFKHLEQGSQIEWRRILREDEDVSRSRYTVSAIRFQLLLYKIYFKNLLKRQLIKR